MQCLIRTFQKKNKEALCLLCEEMSIKERVTPNESVEKAVKYFVNSADKTIQRIVVIELLGIALADDYFANCEMDMIMKISDAFLISKDEFEEIRKAVKDLYALCKKIDSFIAK